MLKYLDWGTFFIGSNFHVISVKIVGNLPAGTLHHIENL